MNSIHTIIMNDNSCLYDGPIWYVHDGSNGDGSEFSPFNSIQSAIDAASSGHTIYVSDGTFNEAISVVSKSLEYSKYYPGRIQGDFQIPRCSSLSTKAFHSE